MALNEMVNIRF